MLFSHFLCHRDSLTGEFWEEIAALVLLRMSGGWMETNIMILWHRGIYILNLNGGCSECVPLVLNSKSSSSL